KIRATSPQLSHAKVGGLPHPEVVLAPCGKFCGNPADAIGFPCSAKSGFRAPDFGFLCSAFRVSVLFWAPPFPIEQEDRRTGEPPGVGGSLGAEKTRRCFLDTMFR